MKTIATNRLNDIYLGPAGNVAVVDGLAACVDACRRASQVNLGELPFAQSRGAPFIAIMERRDLSLYEMYIRKILLTVPEVTGVQSVDFTIDGETINYTAIIQTSFGTGTVTNG